LNFNLPGSAPQHYHMDGVYVEDYMICNVAVVDTDLVNGAIDLLPTTNREFYPFWRYAMKRKYRLTTRISMHQGDVLVRRSTLWHRGMSNKSHAARPMMSLTFGEKGLPAGDPFLAHDGKVFFYPNWYGTSRIGTLRERVEVAAPITRSTFRFVRSLVGHRGYSSY
jgi:ectoine hydroxylase-related dioxygenase (phytanoyl-CoA dioxygenase family)